MLKRFDELTALIRTKTAEHKALTKEKKQTPVWSLLKGHELTKRIAQLVEELEELRSEKIQILARFDYTEDKDVQQVRSWMRLKEKSIDDLRSKESQCEEDFQTAQSEFTVRSEKAKDHDPKTLWPERLKLRDGLAKETAEKLQSHFGWKFSPIRLQRAEADVWGYLAEDERRLKRYLWQKQHPERTERQKKPGKQERER